MRRGINLLREARLFGELLTFAGDAVINRSSLAEEQSKAVLLVPGFMVGDASLFPMGARLRSVGYRVFFAGIWWNVSCPAKVMERLGKSLDDANRATGVKAVVIGHSLGGIYARELARKFPDLVERAILLGAPLKHPLENSAEPIRVLAGMMGRLHRGCLSALGEPCPACGLDLPGTPPPVPETIIYTRQDGVVNWRSCLERGAQVETVEVRSSHCGLAVNLDAWEVILDRLANGTQHRPPSHDRSHSRHPFFRTGPRHLHLVGRPASAA